MFDSALVKKAQGESGIVQVFPNGGSTTGGRGVVPNFTVFRTYVNNHPCMSNNKYIVRKRTFLASFRYRYVVGWL
jgi:hypothetical protein